MAVFKQREDDPDINEAGGEKVNTIIGKDTTFSGNLEVSGTLRVDGVLKGEVNVSDTIAIGPTGQIDANVKTKNAVVSGSVKGNIHATEKVELQAKANITGDLVTKSLVIEQGAVFHGNCNMKQTTQAGVPGSKPPEQKSAPIQPKAPLQTTEKVR
jgi:cytoskeletal protein CcmA (bactofilin family)